MVMDDQLICLLVLKVALFVLQHDEGSSNFEDLQLVKHLQTGHRKQHNITIGLN